MTERSKLGAILLESKMVSPEDVKRALDEQKRSGVRFGEALINLGIVEEEDVGWGLSNQLNLPFIRLSSLTIDQEAVRLVPEPLARRHTLVPFLKIEDELTVVIEDPLNRRAIREVESVCNCRVNVCIGLPEEITVKIDEVYGTRHGISADISELDIELFTEEERKKIAEDYTGDAFLDKLLDHALEKGANAIHFEPRAGKVVIRFRTEREIATEGDISEGWFLVLCNRLKTNIEMVDSKGAFVEGFLEHKFEKRKYVFYTSIVNTKHGNAVTLLNLTPRNFPDDFDDLPIDAETREDILNIIGGRSGLVIVVGTEKTEKLGFINLLLSKKHADMKNTFSIGSMPWFSDSSYMQIKVRVEDRMELLEGMKVALSQDPDIMYVEDLWDRRVMQFALQSAITNLFIVSTLHFPDTLTALEYSNESIENKTLLTKALRGLIGVHVYRTLCPHCKAVDDNYARQARTMKMTRNAVEKHTIYKAVGCEQCGFSGYQGSKMVMEILKLDEDMGEFLKAGHKFSLVREKLLNQGHKTIEQQSIDLVLAGEIAINDFKNVERR